MDRIIDQVKAIIGALEAEGWESMIFIVGGYGVGKDAGLAIDAAASEFF